MERTTKRDLQVLFEMLCTAMNKTAGHNKGDWCLDYAPIYGGYVIENIMEGGGIDHPFGSGRRSAKEMFSSMSMAVRAVNEFKYQQHLRSEQSNQMIESEINRYQQQSNKNEVV